jgi:hypothetical protein
MNGIRAEKNLVSFRERAKPPGSHIIPHEEFRRQNHANSRDGRP